ncbi:MAG: hypothetical protein DHS20C18_35110 [Saprospiraceae bacterium]|nr:MAG: hypothetical protein DHS20C18_35110 [Saprospiraceae bacterium]
MSKNNLAVRLTGFTIIGLLIAFLVLLGLELNFRFNGKYSRSQFQFDENLIWRLRKNYAGTKSWGDDHFPLHFNRYGFRGPDFRKAKNPEQQRIMVIGDSYTAALDVRLEDLYTTQLEGLLNQEGKKYEVINASSPAWGTDQEFIYWMEEGKNFQPDYLLLMVSPNDLREMYMKKLVQIADDGLIQVNSVHYPRKARLAWWLSNRSSFFQYLQKEVWDTHYGHFYDIFEHYPVNFGQGDSTNWDLPLFLKEPFPAVAEARELFQRLVRAMNDSAQKINCQLVLSIIPTQMEFDGTLPPETHEAGAVAKLLTEIAREEQIPYLNLYETLAQSGDASNLFLEWDFHMNEAGNAYLAKQLVTFFEAELLK